MAAQPRHPYARHIRNELAKENLGISTNMLDVISHGMAIISTLAFSSRRNVMMLNVGNNLAMDPNFLAKNRASRIDTIDEGLSKSILATGQCIVSKRKNHTTARANNVLNEILEEIVEEGAEGAFLISAMDDGQVRLELGNPESTGFAGAMSHFIHFEDVSFS